MGRHSFEKALYNRVILPVLYGGVRAAAPFNAKLAETVAGRRDFRDRWRAARTSMPERPVWFHVASVGEYEQARPLITALGEKHTEIPVAISVTSPSGYKYITEKEKPDAGGNIRFVDYLPFDFLSNARFCLAALDPRLLVFVKFDLWPNLVWEAAERNTPTVLIDATLSESSKRYSGIGRRVYASVYSDIEKIVAISEDDANRFRESVPDHPGITVAGDTRYDRVMERKKNNRANKPRIDTRGRLTIIAGSTWPKDEQHLLGALAKLTAGNENLFVVIAPHEPLPERVAGLIGWAESNGLAATTLSAHSKSPGREQIVVVDSVGVLAEIYECGDIAYIGGSFSTGVHSVIEPAIMGIPVLFGPIHKNSFEALELMKRGAAIEVNSTSEIHGALKSLLEDDPKRMQLGQQARAFVESQLGATERCLAAISSHL
jgi:3-deoxy-D-manno-octulosonic-acid transferase